MIIYHLPPIKGTRNSYWHPGSQNGSALLDCISSSSPNQGSLYQLHWKFDNHLVPRTSTAYASSISSTQRNISTSTNELDHLGPSDDRLDHFKHLVPSQFGQISIIIKGICGNSLAKPQIQGDQPAVWSLYFAKISIQIFLQVYGHRPLQGLPFLILEGGDAIEIFTTK